MRVENAHVRSRSLRFSLLLPWNKYEASETTNLPVIMGHELLSTDFRENRFNFHFLFTIFCLVCLVLSFGILISFDYKQTNDWCCWPDLHFTLIITTADCWLTEWKFSADPLKFWSRYFWENLFSFFRSHQCSIFKLFISTY